MINLIFYNGTHAPRNPKEYIYSFLHEKQRNICIPPNPPAASPIRCSMNNTNISVRVPRYSLIITRTKDNMSTT